jgi:ketosteroid isomerase-like protein
MDPAVIDRIRRSYEQFNTTGEFEKDFFDDEIEWQNAPELPGAGLHRGREAVLADLAAQGEAFEWRHAEPHRLIDAGSKVVIFVRGSGAGKSSGAPIVFDVVHVWTIAEGRVRRIEAFLDPDAALQAAGLS